MNKNHIVLMATAATTVGCNAPDEKNVDYQAAAKEHGRTQEQSRSHSSEDANEQAIIGKLLACENRSQGEMRVTMADIRDTAKIYTLNVLLPGQHLHKQSDALPDLDSPVSYDRSFIDNPPLYLALKGRVEDNVVDPTLIQGIPSDSFLRNFIIGHPDFAHYGAISGKHAINAQNGAGQTRTK